MTPKRARATANILMAAAAGAVAYVVLRTPSLRHAVWRAVRTGLTVTLPGYLLHEAREAWQVSGPAPSVRA